VSGAARFIDAITTPTDETLAALGEVLADDVRIAGVITAARGRDAVLDAIRAGVSPLATMIEWREPVRDGDTETVAGTAAPGLPVTGVTLTVRHDGDRVVEITQEIELPPPPDATPLVIEGDIAAAIDGAFDNGTPFIVGYVGGDAAPHVSFRGTVQTFSTDQLGMWIRDPQGGILKGIAGNPNVALLFRDPNARTSMEIAGRARVTEDPAERQRIYDGSPAFEANLDPAMRGVAVIVDVDSLTANGFGGRVRMVR
jgi:hypothetical protein